MFILLNDIQFSYVVISEHSYGWDWFKSCVSCRPTQHFTLGMGCKMKWENRLWYFLKKIDLLLKKYISIKMIDCCKARALRFKALWVRDRVLLF